MAGKRIVFFALGGTIAMSSSGGSGVLPVLTGADVLGMVPGLSELDVDIEVRDFPRKPASWLTFTDILELARAIGTVGDCDGIVVAQGTDTIEETSYLLDLLHDSDQPLVVTGAMRHPEQAGPDGPANLLAAIRVAASVTARRRGCLVVLNDEIHAARWVRKGHTTSPAAFTSPATGPVGLMVEGEPGFYSGPSPRQPLGPITRPDVRVGLAVCSLSDDGGWLHGYQEDGLVVAGFGVGHVPESWVDLLEDLSERIPVMLASRIGAGPVLRGTYGFVGSETDLQDRGLLGAGQLDPYKARILLWTLLAMGATREEIAATFRA